MAAKGGFWDGISSAVKAMTGELAQEVSQTTAGPLTGLFKKGGWGNVMGEAGDLSKIAVRQDYAQEALNLVHGSAAYKGLKGDALTKMDDALDDAFKSFVRGQSDTLGTLGDEVNKAISAGGNEAYDKIIKNFNDIQGKYDIAAKLGTGDDMYKSYFGKESGFLSRAGAYYRDPVYGSNRIGATAGAVVAGGIGIRYLQGGSLTRKANGENDIAGVPFI